MNLFEKYTYGTHTSSCFLLVRNIISCLIVLILGFSMLGIVGCSNKSGKNSDLESGPVAATAYGENIYENYITSLVDAYRKQNNAEDKDAWKKYLEDNSMGAYDIRTQMINQRVSQIRTEKLAKDYNVSVTDDEVNKEIENTKSTFSNDDDWNSYLNSTGQTELSLFYDRKTNLLESKMRESEVGAPKFEDIDESLRKQYTRMYAQAYNTSKKASWILLEDSAESPNDDSSDQMKKAKDLASQIKSGTKSFEDIAKEYSIDDDTKNNGGDLGWDATFINMDYDVLQALQGLSKGDVSDPVCFTYIKDKDIQGTGDKESTEDPKECIAIIKCTDTASFSSDTENIDDFPSGLKEYIQKQIVQIIAQNTYDDLASKKLEEAGLEINNMPEDLPYIVKD